MKDYKQFIRQLPNSTIVCALGEFSPPTVAHELLIKTVQVVAEQRKSAHTVFTASTDLINEEKKEQFLKLMFPKVKFQSLGESFFASKIKELNERYRKVVIIAGADQLDEFKNLKECSNIEIISIGTKDPDADNTKMKQFATKGLYEDFKKSLPSTIRDIDGRRLMNEIRIGLGLDPIKEQVVLAKDTLRENYFKGKIFNVGQMVESNGQPYEIVKRGSNHLLLKDQDGSLVSKWITDVKEISEGVIQPNGTDKIDTNAPESQGNNQVQKPKGKVKGFLTFYNYDDKTKTVSESSLNPKDPHGDYQAKSKVLQDLSMNKDVDQKAVQQRKLDLDKEYSKFKEEVDLQEGKMGQIAADIDDHLGKHLDHYKKVGGAEHFASQVSKTHDHIAKLHGLEKKHAVSLVNSYVDSKLNEETLNEEKPEESADRKKQLKRFKQQAASSQLTQDRPGMGTEFNQFNDPFFKEELTDEEIESMIDELSEEELLGLDEHDEWDLVYEDTEEVIPVHPEEEKIDLMEVLSRQERIKGKIRLRRTQAKRNRTTKINVRRFAPPAVINKRARRLAIKLIKKRMLRGRNPAKVSVGDKERIEKALQKNKALVDRVAQKLVVRERRVEKSRMSKGKSKAGAMPAVF